MLLSSFCGFGSKARAFVARRYKWLIMDDATSKAREFMLRADISLSKIKVHIFPPYYVKYGIGRSESTAAAAMNSFPTR